MFFLINFVYLLVVRGFVVIILFKELYVVYHLVISSS